MTEKIRDLNSGREIEAVQLRDQIGFEPKESKRANISRVSCLVDKKSKRPLLLGVLEINKKALAAHQGVLEKIQAGLKPFGAIIKELCDKTGLRIKYDVINFYELKAASVKAELKKLFAVGPKSKQIAKLFELDDENTTIYGRHAFIKLGGLTICKVIEFISPQLLK